MSKGRKSLQMCYTYLLNRTNHTKPGGIDSFPLPVLCKCMRAVSGPTAAVKLSIMKRL